MNPLIPAAAQPNPLLPQPAPQQAAPGPMQPPQQPGSQLDKAAATIKAMNLSPEQAAQKAQGSQLLVHLLAPLARGDEKVSTKDLAKVAADMVSEGYMSASDAVQMLGKLPTDPAGIKMTVQKLFKGSLLAAINLHGAQALANDSPAVSAPPVAPPPGAPPVAGA